MHYDPNAHLGPPAAEEPLDAANQSLADALKASFGVLKVIMLILVVLYLFSNVRTVESSEQALVLRMGELQPGVHEAGLMWAMPSPFDEIVLLPTKKANESRVKSHTFHRRPEEENQELKFIARGSHQGLNPSLDGALMTSDAGLIHVVWKVTYKIDDVRDYVTNIMGKRTEAAEMLITTLVENVGIHVASKLTAEEMIRTRIELVKRDMKSGVNDWLKRLDSGIVVSLVEMEQPTPPIQVRKSFDNTQKAENTKQRRLREAEQERTRILSEAAGAGHQRFIRLLDEIDRGGTEGRSVAVVRAEVDEMLLNEVEGQAGKMIKDAGAYHAIVVGRMQSDVELYRTLLPEYQRTPNLLIARLWEETRQRIFRSPGVTKYYFPPGLLERRITIPLDPEQTRIEERKRLQQNEFDPESLRPKTMHALGPEAG